MMAVPQPDETSVLSAANLARRWHISLRTLERWRTAGKGPTSMMLGGSVRYRLADVLAFEQARTRPETP